MATFVVHARRTPEVLLRVLLLFHKRGIAIHRLKAEPADDQNGLRITIEVHSDPEHAPRIEANLFKIVDVLSVQQIVDADEISPH